MNTATHPRRLSGTSHRRPMLGTIALAQIAGAQASACLQPVTAQIGVGNVIQSNFGVKPGQALGGGATMATATLVATAYHENGGGSGCIGAGSGDVKNSLDKTVYAHVTRRGAKHTDEAGVTVDPNLLAAHCISSGRMAMQTQHC